MERVRGDLRANDNLVRVQPAIEEAEDASRMLGNHWLMRHDDDSNAEVSIEALEDLHASSAARASCSWQHCALPSEAFRAAVRRSRHACEGRW